LGPKFTKIQKQKLQKGKQSYKNLGIKVTKISKVWEQKSRNKSLKNPRTKSRNKISKIQEQ
jgi:hypothetical protein